MNFRETMRDKIFWLMAVSLAGIIFVTAINSNLIYRAEIEVLFLPKNEVTASNMDQVLGNAERISSLASFHDKVIGSNPNINDEVAELPATKRKEFWNSVISADRIEGSGIIKIAVLRDTQSQTTMIARQSAESLIASMSHFYNIKTELDMRIVEGPIVSRAEKISAIIWFFVSLFLGMILGFIFNFLVDFFVKKYIARTSAHPKQSIQITKSKPAPSIFPRFSLPENMMRGNMTENKSIFDFRVEEEKALVPKKDNAPFPITREKKSSAPDNLPIGEDFNFELETSMPQEEIRPEDEPEKNSSIDDKMSVGQTEKEEESIKDVYKEATPEEVKARLNKLLGGDMLK